MKRAAKLRILYMGPIPPEVGGPSAGGVATHCWGLAVQAAKSGHEVYLLTNSASSFTKNGIKVIAPSQRNRFSKAFCGLKFWLSIKDKSQLKALNLLSFKDKLAVSYGAYLLQGIVNIVKPDLIHVHSLHNLQALSLKLFPNSVPLVITDHGFWHGIHAKGNLAKIKATASGAAYIICVSDFSKRQMGDYRIAPLVKKKVIHNPISIDEIPLLDRDQVKEEFGLADKKVVFFSGVVEPVKIKGLDVLLKAMAADSSLKERCKLVVLANDVGIKYARTFIRRERVDALILGPQPWEKIVKLYNLADVFALPSRSESFGIVYVEALSVGTPVVGFSPILEELERLLGIYIGEKFDSNTENEKTLAKKIGAVISTDVSRDLLRKKVREKLTWDTKFAEFEEVYTLLGSTKNDEINS